MHAFLNMHSGFDDGTACADQLTRQMEAMGVPIEVHQVRKGMDIPAAVRRSLEEGTGAVIAGGGDGTLNAVATALRETSIPMALLPIGTLNHVARDLGVPLDANAAIEALGHSRTRCIDLGEVNGHIFLNNSIIGLYPAYRTARERYQERGRSKWLAILSAVISVFRFNPSFRVRLLVNGREVVRRTPYILVANNEHRMEGYQIGTRDRIDQGLLWVYVMHRLSRWGLVRLACSLLFGRFRKSDDFETFAASSVEVVTRRKRLSVALDGDPMPLSTPLHYRSLPGALTVMCPLESSMHADSAAVENASV